MRIILAAGAWLALLPSAFAADLAVVGEPYDAARARVLAAGWVPQDLSKEDVAQRCSARAEICAAYPETEACAGTGEGQCLFLFTKPDGSRARIQTVGEALPDLTVDRVEDPATD